MRLPLYLLPLLRTSVTDPLVASCRVCAQVRRIEPVDRRVRSCRNRPIQRGHARHGFLRGCSAEGKDSRLLPPPSQDFKLTGRSLVFVAQTAKKLESYTQDLQTWGARLTSSTTTGKGE